MKLSPIAQKVIALAFERSNRLRVRRRERALRGARFVELRAKRVALLRGLRHGVALRAFGGGRQRPPQPGRVARAPVHEQAERRGQGAGAGVERGRVRRGVQCEGRVSKRSERAELEEREDRTISPLAEAQSTASRVRRGVAAAGSESAAMAAAGG